MLPCATLANYDNCKIAFDSQEYAKAFAECAKGAKENDPRAINGLGTLYFRGAL
jgi:hypothetical protein